MNRWLIFMMGLIVLAGCGSVSPEIGSAPAASQAQESSRSEAPTAMDIPSIGVVSSLMAVGVDENDVVVTDFPAMQAAWYEHSVGPGEVGPMVLLGHVDGEGQPGIFNRLAEVGIGDTVSVVAGSGRVYDYEITNTGQYSKEEGEFPTDLVYGPTDVPAIRVITCGGPFGTDRAGHYDDNVIAFGVLTGSRDLD